jgi:prephenate dehydrogenase
MKKLAILGPGLLGGSLAMAVRARMPGCDFGHVALWARREAAVAEALAAGIADTASTDLKATVEGADLVVFCVPIGAMADLARQIVPWIRPDTIITDVGSVKGPVVDALTPIFAQHGRFLGSHPMAGSEECGLSAARASLFEGSTCILTPHPGADAEAVATLTGFWESVGCRIRTLSPEAHDQAISLVSHLPHLLAAILVDFVCAENPESVHFCGNGFRDTTRVASGPAGMWTEILLSNRDALAPQLEGLAARLGEAARLLRSGEEKALQTLLADAKARRDAVFPKVSFSS